MSAVSVCAGDVLPNDGRTAQRPRFAEHLHEPPSVPIAVCMAPQPASGSPWRTCTMARLRRKQDRLYDDRLDDRIPVAVYDRKQKELSGEVVELEEQLSKERTSPDDATTERLAFWETSQTVAERYASAKDFGGRRMVLREIFSNLKLRGNLLLAELKEEARWLAEAVADYIRPNEGFGLQNNAYPQGSALLRAQCCLLWYTRQDLNLRPLAPQANALSS